MVTIYDIAREAGVSASTVSRALNGSRLVSDQARDRIDVIASKLGYKKRLIRRHRDRVILSVKLVLPYLPDAERSLFYEFSRLAEGLRSGLAPCNLNLICDVNRPDFQAFPHKKGGDTDAFVFAFHQPSAEILEAVQERRVPHVVLNRSLPNLPSVTVDHRYGMNLLVDHLAAGTDSLRPRFVQLDRMGETSAERLAGLADACRARGIDFDPQRDVRTFSTMAEVDQAAVAEMARGANALVCVNDIVGLVVLTELDRLGAKIPEDLQVTGFDDSPLRRLTRPLLTTVRLPVQRLARIAGEGLLRQIVEGEEPEPLIKLAGELEVGDSTRSVSPTLS